MTQTRIATGGKAGAGKDFILNVLTQFEAGWHSRRPIVIGGFGLLVQEDYLQVHGRSGEREDWQKWGQLRRAQDEDYWTKKALQWADAQHRLAVIGFSGVRFYNELGILKAGGFQVGLVRAPENVRYQRLYDRDGRWWTDAEMNHRTETSLDEIPESVWDFVINNE